MIPQFPDLILKRPRRPYRLSPKGRAALRVSIALHKPWLQTRGPKTIPGKKRSSQNHLIHGLFTPEFAAERRFYLAALREVRRTVGRS